MTVKKWIVSSVLMTSFMSILVLQPLQAARDDADNDSWGSKVTRFFYPQTKSQDGWLRHSIAAGRAHIFLTDIPDVLLRVGVAVGWIPAVCERTFEYPRMGTLLLGLSLGYGAALDDEPLLGVQRNISDVKRKVLFGLMAAHAMADIIELSSYNGEIPASFFTKWAPTLIGVGTAYAWNALASAEIEHN